jgi:hypothetical protein
MKGIVMKGIVMPDQIISAKELLARHGYQIDECVPAEGGGHLYVLDPVHCVAGKSLKWVESRKVRIASYGDACKFMDDRS